MTYPRRIEPGMTVLVTRRTTRRTHLFRPDRDLNELYLYLLAVISKRHGILVHGVTLMSNHEHLVVTDVHGRLPKFLAELHRMVALCVKVLRKWEGEVWDSSKSSIVELRTTQAIIEKLAYVAANPVAAGLVRQASEWPGVRSLPADIGAAHWVASRPRVYVNDENPDWPATATLELVPPPSVPWSKREIQSATERELAELEVAARDRARANGQSAFGVRKIKLLSPFKRAKGWEPVRHLNPAFAVGRAQRSAFLEATTSLRAFRMAYRAALDAWKRGVRCVIFPTGTWLMRTLHSVAVG